MLISKILSAVFSFLLQTHEIGGNYSFFQPHQWPSCSALKAGRREVPGSIPSRACLPSRSEFSVVSETPVNTNYNPLERLPRRAYLPIRPGPTCGQLALLLQPNPLILSVKTRDFLKKELKTGHLEPILGYCRRERGLRRCPVE